MQVVESLDSIWFQLLQINSSIIYYCWQLLVAIIFLNCILFSLFLLKSLFFKPKFVENLSETISIDPMCGANEIVTRHTNLDGSIRTDESASQELLTQSLISNRIQRLYTTDSLDSIEYMSPKNEKIRLVEKIQAGYYGNLYKIEIGSSSGATRSEGSLLCAKLIDMKRLRMIIGEVNGIPSNFLSQSAHLINLFTSKNEIRRSKLMSQYNKQYKKFIEACTKLELAPSKRAVPRHANIVFYDQVLVYDGKCVNIRATHQKIFKGLAQIDKRQFMHLPSLILLVMPYAKHSLRSILLTEWPQSSVATTTEWGAQIASGLNYLHGHLGIPHLDLKPENILLFETEQRQGAKKVDSESPLHLRYLVKITDCAASLLLPTSAKVMSASDDNTAINTISPIFLSKLTESFQDQSQYDLYCYGMILLLMLVGYKRFSKTFIFSPFPNGLLGTCRYRLTDTISRYDRTIIPDNFVDLLKLLLPRDNLQSDGSGGPSAITISQVVVHPALSSRSN